METIKIKGSEILAKWEKAAKIVASRGRQLGEIGWLVRNNGYDVHTDGFSCGTFSERGIDIRYNYNNFDDVWHLVPVINIGRKKYDVMVGEPKKYKIYNCIDPETEYDVEVILSEAEQFERGLIKPTKFRVSMETYRTTREHRYFDSFEEADKYAQELCQRLIDRRNLPTERDVRGYYYSSVRNNAQLAKEHSELRHYTWYDYKDHPHWVRVAAYEE